MKQTIYFVFQAATSGSANSIKMYGSSKDSSGSYSLNTPLNGILGEKATLAGLTETSSAGTSPLVAQNVAVHGTFTNTVTSTPTGHVAKSKTRTSNYGKDYYLNMAAGKGILPIANLGYYVKPGTTASKIQGAVDAAQSGDNINLAPGKYKENVIIDKSLSIKGTGATNTIVDGDQVHVVFDVGVINPAAVVTLSGLKIQNGGYGGIFNRADLTFLSCSITGNTNANNNYGGGIYNGGTINLYGGQIAGNTVSGYGGGIFNSGSSTVNLYGGSIAGNRANGNGGGIYNTGTFTTTGASGGISANTANNNGGGIYNGGSGTLNLKGGCIVFLNTANNGYGGGIYSENTAVTFDGTKVGVQSNKARQPYSETSWYKGWGVYLATGTPTAKNGFNPATQVTGNTKIPDRIDIEGGRSALQSLFLGHLLLGNIYIMQVTLCNIIPILSCVSKE